MHPYRTTDRQGLGCAYRAHGLAEFCRDAAGRARKQGGECVYACRVHMQLDPVKCPPVVEQYVATNPPAGLRPTAVYMFPI